MTRMYNECMWKVNIEYFWVNYWVYSAAIENYMSKKLFASKFNDKLFNLLVDWWVTELNVAIVWITHVNVFGGIGDAVSHIRVTASDSMVLVTLTIH